MEIQLFNSPQFGNIRTAGTPENPLFCLKDVCEALGLQSKHVISRMDDGSVSTVPILDSLGREQTANFVNEDGLYDVILDSRKPEARAFRKWITSEVIPSIRKTGGYIPTDEQDTDAEIMAKALLISKKTIDQQKQRLQVLEGENNLLEQKNKELAPKAQYTDDVLQAGGTYTHTEMAKELNLRSWKALIEALKSRGIMYKSAGGRYLLYAEYCGRNYTTTRTNRYFKSDGTIGTEPITVWTEEGRMFLHSLFKVEKPAITIADLGITNEALFV